MLTGIDEFIGSPDMLLKMSQLLVYSAKKGNVKSAQKLIDAGIDVNASVKKDGLRALHAAANAGQTEMVRYLICAGAYVNSSDMYGNTALHIAASCDRPEDPYEILQILIQSGADINRGNHTGMTALHLAVATLNYRSTALLIDAGASLEAENMLASTPMDYINSRWGDCTQRKVLLGMINKKRDIYFNWCVWEILSLVS